MDRRPSIVSSNGFNRRRHRTNTLRDSPDEDGGLELQDTVRLRDRLKKDRDRERERERERDLRERSSRSKRRRAERLANNIGGVETSEESVNNDEDEENISASAVRSLTPVVNSVPNHHHHSGHINNAHHSFSQQHNSNSTSSNITNSTNHHHLQHKKSSPPSSASGKIFRPPPVWKSGEEMISVSVPRKARSASTKRSHDRISSSSNNNSGGGGGEKNLRQTSGSPVGQVLAVSSSTPLAAAPTSPSSSNASIIKKLKPHVNHSGPKFKLPKGVSSSNPSSSNPEELEIEIAEVLYGLMTQSQAPSSKKEESAKDVIISNNSSPISNSTSTANPISVVASKRKRPRQIPETTDQTPNSDISSPRLVKITEENGCETGGNSVNSQGLALEPPSEIVEVKPMAGELRAREDLMASKKDEVCSPKEKESASVKAEDRSKTDSPLTATTSVINTIITMVSDVENHKEEKFEINLMAPPPKVKSSPESELMADSKVDQPVLSVDSVVIKEKEDKDKRGNDHLHLVAGENKCKGTGEGVESHEVIENGGRKIDLEKTERDGIGGVNVSGDKLQVQSRKNQMPVQATWEETYTEKSAHLTTSLPLPMSVAAWPGGLPPLGYMAPLQGVVPMDTSTVTPAPIQPVFSHPRPKRCATHCHIARNIHCLQQFMKMTPFWPAPAGPATLFGSKACNFSVMPSADVQGNIAVRGVSNVQDKGQSLASNPSNGGKEKGSQPVSVSDSAPRKQQIMIQQALPPVAPNNLLGPALIFPLNQQPTAIAALPGAPKSSVTGTSTNSSSSASTIVSSTGAGAAAAGMSFNYPNVAANGTQYLAILQNGAYPFPIPAVGAPPNYRGAPAQPMPLFNGSYFSSQMIHPSQLQHSQLTSNQQWQLLQTQQNASPSTGSSASQKHLHSQQQRPQSSGLASGSGNANMQNFVGQKTQQPQQLQQSLNQYRHSSRPRRLDSDMGSEDSPSTTDIRGSRASSDIIGSNFAMPIYPQSYPLIAPPAVTINGSSTQNAKKAHQPQQQGGAQSGVESLPVQSFAMSFGPINGTTAGAGIDISSMAQIHAKYKNSPEATLQNIQMMAAVATAAQPKKSFRISEDGKSGPVDSLATDDERKSFSGKALSGVGQSITFTKSEMADGPTASVLANSVIGSSAQSPSVASVPSRSSRTVTTNTFGAINVPNAHLQQQQLATTAVNMSKVQATSNGSIFPEHSTSSSAMNAKFSNALSGFPQNFVQSNSGSPVHSPQWKTSSRSPTSPAPSSLGSSPGTSHKNLHQQQSRTRSQMQNQISFGGSQKPSSMPQGLAISSSNNQGPPSPMMVGCPTTSTISKGASGSPRTASSTTNKIGQTSLLSTQQPKNVPSIPSQKSPSILGNPHATSSSSSNSAKPQIQQQPQQQLPKTIQQAQLFFSSPYAHSQSPHPTSTSSTTSSPAGYYMQQRRRADQHQQSPGAPVTSSTGLLSVCPVTLSGMSTNDPAKAIAAATGNMKGGGLPLQGSIMQASQFAVQSTGTILPAGFSYAQPVPVKTAEQKQPTV